jgi:DNA-binding CsgD family transcriptional regulator
MHGVLTLSAFPSGRSTVNAVYGLDAETCARIASHPAEDIIALWGGPEKIPHYPLEEPLLQSNATDRSTWADNGYSRLFDGKGVLDVVGIGLARDHDMFGSLGLGRHESAGEVEESELAGLRLLAPHIRRAATISRLFDLKAIETSTFSATIEALGTGVVLVDDALAILFANTAATAMLTANDPIVSRRGRLGVRHLRASKALEDAIAQAAQDEALLGRRGFAIPTRDREGEPNVLHVLPLRRGEIRPGLERRAAAAVFVARRSSGPLVASDALALLYELTPAETRVMEMIGDGRTSAEIASACAIAPSTVKTHLRRVFEKTRCRRQSDVVKLTASLSTFFLGE